MKLLIFFVILIFSTIGFAKNLVFITNKETKLPEADLKTIKMIYTGKTLEKASVKPVMLSMSHNETKEFIKKYLNMSLFEFDQYWLEKELSGQVVAPKTFYDSKKLIGFIQKNKGFVAYVNKKLLPSKKNLNIYNVPL